VQSLGSSREDDAPVAAGAPRYHLACRGPWVSWPSPRPLWPAMTGRTRPGLVSPSLRLDGAAEQGPFFRKLPGDSPDHRRV